MIRNNLTLVKIFNHFRSQSLCLNKHELAVYCLTIHFLVRKGFLRTHWCEREPKLDRFPCFWVSSPSVSRGNCRIAGKVPAVERITCRTKREYLKLSTVLVCAQNSGRACAKSHFVYAFNVCLGKEFVEEVLLVWLDSHDFCVKSTFFEFVLKNFVVDRSVAADGDEVGLYLFDFFKCAGDAAKDDFVGNAEFFDEFFALVFGEMVVGSEFPRCVVSCNGNDEFGAEFFCGFKIVDVSGVHAVKCAECHHDFFLHWVVCGIKYCSVFTNAFVGVFKKS